MTAVSPEVEAARWLAWSDLLMMAADTVRPPTASGERLARVARESIKEVAAFAGAEGVVTSLETALRHLSLESPETVAADYARLFEGSVACAINETAYIRRDKGAILADIGGFHRAFGFELREDAGEKSDHLVAELEFCAVLLVMFANAIARREAEAEAVTRDALRSFLVDHLGEWWEGFAGELEERASSSFYRHVAVVHRDLARVFAAALGIETSGGCGPAADDEGTPYECDMAACQSREAGDDRA